MTQPRPTPPLGYHLTWNTYGTWLPGDERGWVQRGVPGRRDPSPGLAAWAAAQLRWPPLYLDRAQRAAAQLRWPPLYLDRAQRAAVAAAFEAACARRGWTLRALAIQTAHVHVTVEADADASEVRGALKRAATTALRRRWPSLEGREVWAGSGWTTSLLGFSDVDRSVDYAARDHHRPRR